MIQKIQLQNTNTISTLKSIKQTQITGPTNPNNPTTTNIPQETLKAYNNVSFRAKEIDFENNKLFMDTLQKLNETNPKETMSIEEAVKTLLPLKLPNKNLLDFIMGCSFETQNGEVIISKPAIYQALLLHEGDKNVNKLMIPRVMATSLDNENREYSSKKFESLFDIKNNLKLRAQYSLKDLREEAYPYAKKYIKMQRNKVKEAIENIVENKIYSPFYQDMNEENNMLKEKQEIINLLEKIRRSYPDVPEELCTQIETAVKNGNYNIKEIYSKFYSKINDCETLKEVKELYPTMIIPDYHVKNTGIKHELRTRLASENFDKIGLNILKQLYIDLISPIDIKIYFKDYPATSYNCLKKTNINFGNVPKEMKMIFNRAEKLLNQQAKQLIK